MRAGILTIMLAVTVVAGHAEAQSLSLDEAIARALAAEPSVRAFRAEVEASRALRLQAGLRSNPSLSFERREEPAGKDNQTMVGVTWPLDFRRRDARVSVADREIEVAEQELADRMRLVVRDVRTRYGDVAAALRDAGVAERLATSARQQLDLLRQRVEQGASPPLERDMLEVELRRLESARLLAAGRAGRAMFQLKGALGMGADTPLALGQPLEALSDSEVGPAIATDALEQRPDIVAAQARVRLADARIRQARREGGLDLSVFGSYTRMDSGFPQRGLNDAGHPEPIRGVFHYAAGGMMVTIPLGNRNQGEIAVAEARRAAESARLEAVQLAADNEVAAAQAYALQARDAAAAIAEGTLLAQKNLAVVREMYELGRSTLADVLAEQRRYLEMEMAYTTALREAFEARTALAFARGERR